MTRFRIITVALCLAALGCSTPTTHNAPDTTPAAGGTAGATAATPVADLVFPDEEFRKSQPHASEPRSFKLPQVQTFKLGKQIDVYLVERHELPTISVELELEGGEINDARGKEGMASVCMSLVSEGTKELNKIAFNEALADIASRVASSAGRETQSVSMRTLSKHFDATFALYSDTITEPGFRKEDLDRIIKRRLESLKQAKASPGSVAGRVRNSILFGQKHPFGRITTEKSLGSITLSDCKRYHRSYVKPKGARLFVVGDMTRAQLETRLAPLLAKWKGMPKRSKKLTAARARKGKVFFVDVPNSAQSSIYIMHMGPHRKDPAFFANQMMAQVLGGGFSSRINMNLREDKGYSYGARGGFGYFRDFGTFTASSSVRADATRQSLVEIFGEMRQIKTGTMPASVEELSREKSGAILGLPARFATAGQALSAYNSLVYYGLPLDYYNTYVENIQGVELAQVKAAAAKLLAPDEAIVLVVGDSSAAQIIRDEAGKDIPLKDAGGNDVKLLGALNDLAKSGEIGRGAFVVLDADGNVKESYE